MHSFENVCEIIPDRASGLRAVYEQEKRNRDKKCYWRLKKYLNWNKYLNSRSLTRQVCNFPRFTFLIIV